MSELVSTVWAVVIMTELVSTQSGFWKNSCLDLHIVSVFSHSCNDHKRLKKCLTVYHDNSKLPMINCLPCINQYEIKSTNVFMIGSCSPRYPYWIPPWIYQNRRKLQNQYPIHFTHIYDCSLYWLETGTSMKSGGVKLICIVLIRGILQENLQIIDNRHCRLKRQKGKIHKSSMTNIIACKDKKSQIIGRYYRLERLKVKIYKSMMLNIIVWKNQN